MSWPARAPPTQNGIIWARSRQSLKRPPSAPSRRSVWAGGTSPITSALTLGSDAGQFVDGCMGERAAGSWRRRGRRSVVTAGASVVVWLPGPSTVGSKIVALEQIRELSEDDREGQFEGQNGANECLSEPVSACVS